MLKGLDRLRDGVIALKRNIMMPPLSVVYWPGRKNRFSAVSEVATFYTIIHCLL